MDRSQFLDQARHVVTEREEMHGAAEATFNLIAAYWSNLFGIEVTPREVALAMCLLKIARAQQFGGITNEDNYIDLIGYAALAGELSGKVQQTNT